MTLCDRGGGQNWPKKRYITVERPLMGGFGIYIYLDQWVLGAIE